jgi:hypothetical protein
MFPRFGIEVRELGERERKMHDRRSDRGLALAEPRRTNARALYGGPTLMPLHAKRCSTKLSIMRVFEAALNCDAYLAMMPGVAAATARG